MRRFRIMLAMLAILSVMAASAASGETIPGIWEALGSVPTAEPASTATPAPNAFRFRDGIRWGMNTQQVRALETEAMNERAMQDWSIMVTSEKVAVSRFTADLVFMFRQDRLLMITYEFQRQDAKNDFQYLTGALSSLYGEKTDADPVVIKTLMDGIYPNRYRTEWLTEPCGWITADGTAIYQYFYSSDTFAVMYVSPELGGGIYQTNGL